jgi:hypothetical protein
MGVKTSNSYYVSPPIVTNGLVIYYDPAYLLSAQSGSSVVTEIGGINNMPLTMSVLTTYGSNTSASYNSSYGGTLKFDGTGSYLRCPTITSNLSSSMQNGNPKSMFAWVNVSISYSQSLYDTRVVNYDDTDGVTWCNILLTGDYAASTQSFQFGGTCNANINWGFTGGPLYTTTAGTYLTNGVPCNNWVYIGWTYDTLVTFQCYYNSIPIAHGQQPAHNTPSNTGDAGLLLGAKTDTTSAQSLFFPGLMGPVQIYNRSLSQAEVVQNYNAQKSRFGLT